MTEQQPVSTNGRAAGEAAANGALEAMDDAKLRWIYLIMRRIRRFEETAEQAFLAAKMRGALHFYIGEEATATGVCAALDDGDYITSTHRGHGHCIAKGARMDKMMAELFGRTTGYSGGKGGSMHIADIELGNLGANGIVGAGIPIAAGAALGSKIRKDGKVTVCLLRRWRRTHRRIPRGRQRRRHHELARRFRLREQPVRYGHPRRLR